MNGLLITGAAGFTGRAVRALAGARDLPFTALVRRPAGLRNERVCDLSDVDTRQLTRMLDEEGIDRVVHLASAVDFSGAGSPALYRANTLATHRLALACKATGARLVFASGTLVQGNPELAGPGAAIDPLGAYGYSKWLAEELAGEVLEDNLAILRIGGIFGLGGPQHLGLNRTIAAALEQHAAPVLHGQGEGRRNYIYVHDLARWIIALAEDFVPGVHYLGGGETLSLKDLLGLVARVFNGNDRLERRAGESDRDQLCAISPPPVSLMTYGEAFADIRERRGADR